MNNVASNSTARDLMAELVERRNALGVSRAEFARRIGVHPATLQGWERGLNGSPSIELLERYAAGVGLKIEVKIVEWDK